MASSALGPSRPDATGTAGTLATAGVLTTLATTGTTGTAAPTLIIRHAARLFRSSEANQTARPRERDHDQYERGAGSVAPRAAAFVVDRRTVECRPRGWDPPDGAAGFAAKPAVPLHDAASPPASVATMEIGTFSTPDGIANGTRTIVRVSGATAARTAIVRDADPCTSTRPTIVFEVAPPFWNVISKKV